MKFLILSFSLISSMAVAGPQGSGGGKGVVCHDSRGRIKSVELLDLWEARQVYRFNVKSSNTPVQRQIAEKIEALKNVTQIDPGMTYSEGDAEYSEPEYLKFWLTKITGLFFEKNSKYVFETRGASLVPTDDSLEIAVPDGNCEIKQLVNYVDSTMFPHIMVDAKLVARMDNTNKAALYLHEALYVYLRGYSGLTGFDQNRETNSIRVRRAIGYVFAGNRFLALAELLPQRYLRCQSQNARPPTMHSTFYVYYDADGRAHEVTTQLFGKRMLGFVPENRSSIVPEELVKDEVCSGTDPVDTHRTGPSVYNIYGSGPVDYQMQVWLGGACDRGKRVMLLMVDRYVGPSDQEAQVLRCSWVDRKDPGT